METPHAACNEREDPMTSTHALTEPRPTLCAVTLIDRRTGRPHRVNGAALVALSRDPHAASADLLTGRDPLIWSTRIQPLNALSR